MSNADNINENNNNVNNSAKTDYETLFYKYGAFPSVKIILYLIFVIVTIFMLKENGIDIFSVSTFTMTTAIDGVILMSEAVKNRVKRTVIDCIAKFYVFIMVVGLVYLACLFIGKEYIPQFNKFIYFLLAISPGNAIFELIFKLRSAKLHEAENNY